MFENHFPILKRKVNGQKLVYLDNASTTQKPREVIEAISDYYKKYNANIHRGIHTLSAEATHAYEAVRDKVRKFINAKHREEIIFTSGATEAINLVAATWGEVNIKRGDEILLTEMEHHSNIVPWQVLAKKKGAKIKYIPVISTSPTLRAPSPGLGREGVRSNQGTLDLSNLNKLITKRTKIVSVVHISNTLGTINPIEKIIKAAHKKGALILIDGAQAGAHAKIDVQKLGCDFYVLSGHKMYGPTGVGVLYGRKELLEKMPPYQTGGHMIKRVGWQESTWNDLPYKFEAGTANIADVIGLGAAINFLNSPSPSLSHQGRGKKKNRFPSLDGRGKGRVIDWAQDYESQLTNYALRKLQTIPGIIIYPAPVPWGGVYGPAKRGPVISFNIKGIPPHDLASLLDERGIAIRTGHHCTMPLHKKLGVEATARVSFALYNTKKDIDKLIRGIRHALSIFSPPHEGPLRPSEGEAREMKRGS